jgi:A/G-specific adenine glycosylase
VFFGREPADVDPPTVSRVAAVVVPAEAAYAWNQALMDLGATLCRARRPACLLCPLRDLCVAVRSTRQLREPRGAYSARERAAAEARARRGRVVDALRGLPPGATLDLAELAQRLEPPEPEPRLAWLVDRLSADGLLALERDPGDGRVRLRLAD